MITNKHHLTGLTWLRALAAILVVFTHVIRAAEDSYLKSEEMHIPSFMYIFDLGTFGVLLFFTLSGTTLYISQSHKKSGLTEFLIKRFFRIWPAFAVAIIFYLLFRPIFEEYYPVLLGNWIEGQFTNSYNYENILAYLSMSSNFFAPSGLFNNAFWSLPVEFQYYLCFPALYWLSKKTGAAGPFLFGLGLYLIYKYKLIDVYDTKVFMLGFSFCFGVIIGWLYTQKKLTFKLPFSGALLCSVFLVAAILTQHPSLLPNIPVISGLWNCYIILAAIAVYLVLFNEPNLPKSSIPYLMRLGEISYSLYLWHNIVIAAVLLSFIHLDFLNGSLPFFALLAATTAFSIVISNISYNLIEKQGMKFGSKLIIWMQPKHKFQGQR